MSDFSTYHHDMLNVGHQRRSPSDRAHINGSTVRQTKIPRGEVSPRHVAQSKILPKGESVAGLTNLQDCAWAAGY